MTRRGMTLIELVIGLVITGAMASIGAATFGSLIDHRAVIMDATVEAERAVALRTMLHTWIESGTIVQQLQNATLMISRGGSVTIRRTRTARSGPTSITNPAARVSETGVVSALSTGDELTFQTNALPDAASNEVNVRLFVDGDSNTPEHGLTIEYRISNQSPLQRRMLDSTITGMTVEYLDATTRRWIPASQPGSSTRAAVRVFFTVDASLPQPRLLQLPLLFVLPNAANAIDAAENEEVEAETGAQDQPGGSR